MKRRVEICRRQPLPRSGAIMVFALIAFLLASMLIAAMLRTASMSHRQMKREEFRIQASFLADAGCARAIGRLRGNPEFRGETWSVPAQELSGDRTAIVELTVTSPAEAPGGKSVSAVVEYPSGNADRVRITRSVTVLAAP
jgi:type II secretory pathway component PulK